MKVALPRRLLGPVFVFVALGFLAVPLRAAPPGVPAAHRSHTALVLFADHPLPSGEWPSLFVALQSIMRTSMPETHELDPSPSFLRGDHFVPGTLVESPIVIFLHGNCALHPGPLPNHYGVPLGWVRDSHGVIQPFVDVDCTEIGRLLGMRAALMTRQQRVPAMAEAMARVIIHEWIHIAAQSPCHTRTGVEKASFSSSDLLGNGTIIAHSEPGIANAVVSAPPEDMQAAIARIELPK